MRKVHWSQVNSPHEGSIVRIFYVFFSLWFCFSFSGLRCSTDNLAVSKMKSQYGQLLSLLCIPCISEIDDDINVDL